MRRSAIRGPAAIGSRAAISASALAASVRPELAQPTHQRHSLPRTRRPEAAGRMSIEASKRVPAAVGVQRQVAHKAIEA